MADEAADASAIPWTVLEASDHRVVDLRMLASQSACELDEMPFTLRVLLENVARNLGPGWASIEDIKRLLNWGRGSRDLVLPIKVTRVLLPDSSGLPVLMDLAALRGALARRGRRPESVQPQVPVDLVVDHSVAADHHGRPDALALNMKREFERNAERYSFFKWAQQAFAGVRIVPPGIGIVHQVHLERLARVVESRSTGGQRVAHPEFVLGGDSHTPMVNGLGVLGWGVGGVEAEAAMLDQPYMLPLPRIVGVRLTGRLPTGATTTDLVLTMTERLRRAGVVAAIVEFFGPGCDLLPVTDRATVANMAPEYGATAAYFPIDRQTIDYLRQTGRDAEHVALVEAYARRNALFREPGQAAPMFDERVDFDLGEIERCVAGPTRPQDRLRLSEVPRGFRAALGLPPDRRGFGLDADQAATRCRLVVDEQAHTVTHGMVAIAAITSCTNTSNPGVMLAAGLLARNAVAAGLKVPPYVKTSLAPGSRVVTRYLADAGLLEPLASLGFHVVGYGCTTCSGKSGALRREVSELIDSRGLVAAAVVSSNRNFEGRIHRQLRAAYLASPPLVVAYAIAGRVDLDLEHEPLGHTADGRAVFLHEIWPQLDEIDRLVARTLAADLYLDNYSTAFDGTEHWKALQAPAGPLFPWNPSSTYLLEPPFFDEAESGAGALPDALDGARALAVFGDSLTTDHISPAGEIPTASDAGRYLSELGVPAHAFNAFTMRRGNHHVMARGTFANVRIRNLLVPGRSGGLTVKLPEHRLCSIHEAAQAYAEERTPLIVIGGKDYGMGSSRDWAAKGPRLLGVKAVLAQSFERIHRANLIALGIVPLRFAAGESPRSLGLTGEEAFRLSGLRAGVEGGAPIAVRANAKAGEPVLFTVHADVLSSYEASLLLGGGLFARVLRTLLAAPGKSVDS